MHILKDLEKTLSLGVNRLSMCLESIRTNLKMLNTNSNKFLHNLLTEWISLIN